jgi:hypothetical protein
VSAFVAVAVIVGKVLSTLMSSTVADAELSALSYAVPLADWFAPSPRTTSGGQVFTPERASSQVKLTVTSSLFKPFAFAAGERCASIVGAVRSNLMPVTDADVLLPALSETDTGPAPRSAPSPVIVESAGTVAGSTPERASDAVQWIVTSLMYQPSAVAGVVGAPERFGAVRSMLMSETVAEAWLPTRSCAVPETD